MIDTSFLHVGEGRPQSHGRQLPLLLTDGEDALETTMADELAITGGIPSARGAFVHPEGEYHVMRCHCTCNCTYMYICIIMYVCIQ